MIRNYFLTAIRHFWKNKSFSFINITGLALSMAVCLLLIIIIRDAHTYDRFHANADRIYRLNTEAIRKNGGSELYASSPWLVGATLVSNYSGIQASTFLYQNMTKDFKVEDRKFEQHFYFSNPDFFKVFDFSAKWGNLSTALAEPNALVLTRELSEKLFPGQDPIGKSVEIEDLGLFRITAVLNPFPGKTHLEFDALVSFASVPLLEKEGKLERAKDDWKNYYLNYTYILLKPGARVIQANALLAKIAKENYSNLVLETRDAGYRFYLQALHAIVPGPMLSNNMGRALSSGQLWFFSMLAIIIIISAAFNYTNLTLAKAMGRMKEIAMRKIVGSSKRHIFFQVLLESIITSMIALGIAVLILQLLIPPFARLQFIHSANINFNLDLTLILAFIVFAILLGIVAGLLPSLFLCAVNPLVLLQKLKTIPVLRHLGLRKSLLVIQFAISIIFVCLVTILYRQTEYGININFGTKRTHIFNVFLQGHSYDIIKNEFEKIHGVEQISGISSLMGTYWDETDDVRISKEKEAVRVRQYFVDENYLGNMDLQLTAGRNFIGNHQQKKEEYAIVNEKFVHQFNLGTPMDAIGKSIFVGDSTMLIIQGVLRDFLYKPSNYELEPLLLRYNPKSWAFLNLSIGSDHAIRTIASLESAWKKIDPYHPFDGRFYVDEIQRIFAEFRDVTWMISFIGFLGITIACLGLLGITMFAVQSKIREICIRKVVGASPLSLVRLLSGSYVQVLAIAILIATPTAAFLGYKLLEEISQRISLSFVLFIPGIALILFLSFLTVGTQTIRAALLNPVRGLRDE
jgi:putative ABC transport system permease protein